MCSCGDQLERRRRTLSRCCRKRIKAGARSLEPGALLGWHFRDQPVPHPHILRSAVLAVAPRRLGASPQHHASRSRRLRRRDRGRPDRVREPRRIRLVVQHARRTGRRPRRGARAGVQNHAAQCARVVQGRGRRHDPRHVQRGWVPGPRRPWHSGARRNRRRQRHARVRSAAAEDHRHPEVPRRQEPARDRRVSVAGDRARPRRRPPRADRRASDHGRRHPLRDGPLPSGSDADDHVARSCPGSDDRNRGHAVVFASGAARNPPHQAGPGHPAPRRHGRPDGSTMVEGDRLATGVVHSGAWRRADRAGGLAVRHGTGRSGVSWAGLP
jgi:hypothetical protein